MVCATDWFPCTSNGQNVWIELPSFSTNRYSTKALPLLYLVGSHRQIRLPGSGGGVGWANKFVLLDMTEEPEAKKLTVYNTNEI